METPQEISTLAKNLNKYELEEVLSATFIMDTLNKDLVLKYLDEMKKTDNLLILIGNDDY